MRGKTIVWYGPDFVDKTKYYGTETRTTRLCFVDQIQLDFNKNDGLVDKVEVVGFRGNRMEQDGPCQVGLHRRVFQEPRYLFPYVHAMPYLHKARRALLQLASVQQVESIPFDYFDCPNTIAFEFTGN
jgi:hypothetical protein